MTANELLSHQLEDVSYQLEKVLEGVKEADLDFKPVPTAMSIREQVEHLCEVYTAVDEESRGIEHAWGEFSFEDKSWSNLVAQFATLRAKAVEVSASPADPKGFISTSGFMIGHEYYHIGQLSSLRIATDSSWDPYSIYRHG